jgi:hypothetical protein
LSRYSVSEEEYRAWRAEPRPAGAGLVRVEEIRFQPLQHASVEFLRTRLRTRPGEEVSLATLESDLARIYASGDFLRVDYQLLPGPKGGTIVEIEATERPGGTNFVRFDHRPGRATDGDKQFVLRCRPPSRMGQSSRRPVAEHPPARDVWRAGFGVPPAARRQPALLPGVRREGEPLAGEALR